MTWLNVTGLSWRDARDVPEKKRWRPERKQKRKAKQKFSVLMLTASMKNFPLGNGVDYGEGLFWADI
jgi:hypothetical protein